MKDHFRPTPSATKLGSRSWLDRGSRFSGDSLPSLVQCRRCWTQPRPSRGEELLEDPAILEAWRRHDYCYPPYQFRPEYLISDKRGTRPPSSTEREKLMGFPENHTISCRPTGDRKQAAQALEDDRCSLLGSSFHVPSVATLLAPLLVDWDMLDGAPSRQSLLEGSMGRVQESTRLTDAVLREALARDLVASAIHGGQDARVDASSALPPDAWPRRAVPADRWT